MKQFTHLQGLPELTELRVEQTDGKRYYFSPDEVRLPSVTTVLGHFKKASIDKWKKKVGEAEATRIGNQASIRGTAFHLMMERYIKNEPEELIFEDVMPDMMQAFWDMERVLDFIDNIHYIECPLYSTILGTAGRVDLVAEYGGELSIIDFKTSLKLKKEEWIQDYFEQETAYSLMLRERTGLDAKKIVTLISVDHEIVPQVFIKNRDDFISPLKWKLNRYRELHQ